jgi:lipopolysaccharide transport system permease protein
MQRVITPYYSLSQSVRDIFRFRSLIGFFIWRELKVRYKHTLLGVLWSVLQPALLTAVLYTVWHNQSVTEEHYLQQLIWSICLWTYISSSLNYAINSITSNEKIIKKNAFPRLVLPVSAIFVALFELFINCMAAFIFLSIYKHPFNPSFALLDLHLPVLICTILFSLGAGFWVSSLSAMYKDVRYALPFLIQLVFFLTPVFYEVSSDKVVWGQWININPLSGIFEAIKHNYSMPPLYSWMFSLMLCITGIVFFQRNEFKTNDLL